MARLSMRTPAVPGTSAAAPGRASLPRPNAARACRPSVRVNGGKTFIDPVEKEATAFAPATVANLGPGFDWLGCAVEGEGDTVIATVLPDRPGEVIVESITGDNGRLSLEAADNCAGIGAIEVLKQLPGPPSCGVSLKLIKGLPLGSGMGSSAASAAAGAAAVNALFGNPLTGEQMVLAGLVSEAAVSGYHADNIAPAVLGGFVLVRSADPLDLQLLPFGGEDLWFTLVNPVFEAPTKEMRAVLPAEVPFKSMINNSLQGASLVSSILAGDVPRLGKALDSDVIIEPTRGPLIPGFMAVKEAAKEAGAYGCTISGAGPTVCAVVSDPDMGAKVGEKMAEAFQKQGKLDINTIQVVKLNKAGAKLL